MQGHDFWEGGNHTNPTSIVTFSVRIVFWYCMNYKLSAGGIYMQLKAMEQCLLVLYINSFVLQAFDSISLSHSLVLFATSYVLVFALHL